MEEITITRLTFEEIKEEFFKENLIIITDESDYKNYSSVLEYVCLMHPDKIRKTIYSEFKRGVRCKNCRNDANRLSYEYVYNYFAENDCKLLSKTYITVDDKLEYKCVCGNKDIISFYRFKMGRRCRECSIKKANHSGIKHRYENVKKYIEEFDFTLLTTEDEYINATTKVKLMCNEGHEYEATFKNFKKGRRCPDCMVWRGEERVRGFLKTNKLSFKAQYTFKDLSGTRGNSLRFDFCILNQKDPQLILIEYDGEMHFKAVKWFGGEEYLLSNQIRDEKKNHYCLKNNIPLIRIPYWDYENIEYILTNVLAYYNRIESHNIDQNIIHNYLVNHPEWTQETYLSQEPK